MFKKIFIYILLGLGFLLTSCYSHKIFLNSDKNSGSMVIEYSLDDDYFQLLSIAFENFASEKNNDFDPVMLIDENVFKESFKNTDDYTLRSVNIDNTNGYKGEIVIDFKNIEKILNELPSGIINQKVVNENNTLTISQILKMKDIDPDEIFKNFIEQQKDDDIKFYNKITKEAKFNFVINSKIPIKKAEGINLSADKKTARYSFKLNDLLSDYNKVFKFLISL